VAFTRATTNITLNDDGDAARLLRPDGSVADEWAYGDDPGEDTSWARVPDGATWYDYGLPTPGGSNVLRFIPGLNNSEIVPIGVMRSRPEGAWGVVEGRVTAPSPLLGKRFLYIQDDTGGIALYLGRGEWGQTVEGQTVRVMGYLRRRSGELQFYVRNYALVSLGPIEVAQPVPPIPVLTGQVGEATEGLLVTVTGRVVRLESQAFWIDDGSGAARILFSSTTGVKRPKIKRGEWWSLTGIVTERTTQRDAALGVVKFRVQPRFLKDVVALSGPLVFPVATETPAPGEIIELPTEEPTATLEPTATPEP
jgi:hypothetical protein